MTAEVLTLGDIGATWHYSLTARWDRGRERERERERERWRKTRFLHEVWAITGKWDNSFLNEEPHQFEPPKMNPFTLRRHLGGGNMLMVWLESIFLLFYFLGHAEAVKPAGTTTLTYRHLMKLLRPACLQAVAVFFLFFFYTSSQLEKHYHCSGVIFLTPGECESNIHSPFSSVPFFFNPLPREISGSLAARRSTMLASCSFCQCAVYFSSIQVGVGEVFFFFFSRKQLLLRVWCRK